MGGVNAPNLHVVQRSTVILIAVLKGRCYYPPFYSKETEIWES